MTDDERLGPPPIEPLSDLAWSRVERGLWSQLDAAETTAKVHRAPSLSRRWWLVAAPLAATAAVLAIMLGTRPSPRAVEVIDEPARVVSGSAPSAASFGDSHVELDAATAVVMSHENGHPIVLLERGAAWFTVAPRKERPEFVVRAGDATVRVVGTRFRVARSDEQIAVTVERGVVDVQFRGRVAAVGAHQRWSSESPAQIAVATEATSSVARPEPSRPAEPAETVLDTSELTTPSPTPVTQKPTVKHATQPVAKPDGKPDAKAEAKPEVESDWKLDLHPESKPGVRSSLDTDARPEANPGAASADVAAPIDRDRAEYDRLAALEPRDPATALAGYLVLARGASRWADPALFAAGRLATDRHDRRAATLLEIYLQRFPNGANATDAKQLLARLNRIDRVDRIKGETP